MKFNYILLKTTRQSEKHTKNCICTFDTDKYKIIERFKDKLLLYETYFIAYLNVLSRTAVFKWL